MTLPIAAIDNVLSTAPLLTHVGVPAAASQTAPTISFGEIMTSGMKAVDHKIATADDLVKRFTLGSDVPVHQVTYALEEARMSVELAMQVRGRLLDGYRELMNMQL